MEDPYESALAMLGLTLAAVMLVAGTLYPISTSSPEPTSPESVLVVLLYLPSAGARGPPVHCKNCGMRAESTAASSIATSLTLGADPLPWRLMYMNHSLLFAGKAMRLNPAVTRFSDRLRLPLLSPSNLVAVLCPPSRTRPAA